jgi:thiaminase/transcriptional activator TenA
MTLTCQALLAKFSQEWQAATIHPFLQACQSGTIEPTQFHTWLVQDYLFVTEFTRFVGRVLAAAPIQDFDVLLVGLSALQDELQWFGEKAAERSLTLSTPPCLTCQRYSDFMGNLVNAPYAVQAVALWAIEYAYNQGWQLPGKMPPPYDEFADRWGNVGFTEYVQSLARQADAALQVATPEAIAKAQQVFLRVVALERDFWQMAYDAT